MRERITSDTIRPGDLIEGRTLGIPEYYRVMHVREIDGVTRAVRHVAIEVGAKRARKVLSRLYQRVRRLAKYVARYGCHLCLHAGGLSDGPPAWSTNFGAELRLTVWIISKHTIRHQVYLDAMGWYLTIDHARHGLGRRADTVWRRLEAAGHARQVAHEKKAAEYLEALAPDIRRLAETARPTCLRVSLDGSSVTELLHDCGGTMVSEVSVDSLAAMQRAHDRIYHPDRVA